MSLIETLPQAVMPPKAGDVALYCKHAPELMPHEPGTAAHWFELDPPAVLNDPKSTGNMEAKWLACCQGCLDNANGVPAAVEYTHHAELASVGRGRWMSTPDGPPLLS